MHVMAFDAPPVLARKGHLHFVRHTAHVQPRPAPVADRAAAVAAAGVPSVVELTGLQRARQAVRGSIAGRAVSRRGSGAALLRLRDTLASELRWQQGQLPSGGAASAACCRQGKAPLLMKRLARRNGVALQGLHQPELNTVLVMPARLIDENWRGSAAGGATPAACRVKRQCPGGDVWQGTEACSLTCRSLLLGGIIARQGCLAAAGKAKIPLAVWLTCLRSTKRLTSFMKDST